MNPLAPRPVPQYTSSPPIKRSDSLRSGRSVKFQEKVVSPRRTQSTMRDRSYMTQPPLSAVDRAHSVGRIRDYAAPLPDDPDQVTQAILDLRATRAESKRKSRSSAGVPPSKLGGIMQSFSGNSNGSSQQENRRLSPRHTDNRLRDAEQKMDGLMQELDDLKFFEELDQADSSPARRGPGGALSPRHQMRSASTGRLPQQSSHEYNPYQPLHSHHSSSPPPPPPPASLRTPRGDLIPAVIRAVSPTHGRLPPPVALDAEDNDTVIDLSPRKISRMDRMALELETQTLIRRVQVLMKEKASLKRQVHGFEVSLDQQEAKQHEQVKHMEQQVQSDYKRRLETSQFEIQQIRQEKLDLQAQVDLTREQLKLTKEQSMTDVLTQQSIARKEAETLKARLAVLEQLLTENNRTMSMLEAERDHERQEVDELKQQLATVGLADTNREELEQYVKKLEADVGEANKKHHDERVQREGEQAAFKKQIKELAAQAEGSETDYQTKLKESQSSEKRKIRDLEEAYTKKSSDYKKKIKSLQEQLKTSNDRYEKDRESREADEVEATAKLEKIAKRLQKLESENSKLRKDSGAKKAMEALQKELEDMEAMNQKETGRWKKKCSKLEHKVAEREAKIEELRSKTEADEFEAKSQLEQIIQEQEKKLAEKSVDAKATEMALEERIELCKHQVQATKIAFEAQVAKLEKDLKVSNDLATEKQRQKDAEVASKSGLQNQLQEKILVETELQRKVKELQTIASAHELSKTALLDKDKEIEEYKSKCTELQEQFESEKLALLSQNRALSCQLEEGNKTRESLESMHVRSTSEVSSLRLQHSDATQRAQDLETKLRLRLSEIDSLKQQLSKKEHESSLASLRLEESKDKLEKLQTTHDKLVREVADDSAIREKRLSALLSEVEDGKENIIRMTDEKRRLQGTIDDLKFQIERVQGRLESSEKAVSLREQEANDLKAKLDKSSSQLADTSHVAAELVKQKGIADDLLKKLTSEQNLNESRALEINKLQDERFQLVQKVEKLSELEKSLSETKEALAQAEQDKVSQVLQLGKLQQECESALDRLSGYDEKKVDDRMDIEDIKDLTSSDIHERLSSTIRDLQDKLASERNAKEDMIERMGDIEADLELKEHQLTRLPKLQSQLKDMIRGREELQAQLGRVEAELERKDRQLSKTSKKYDASVHELKEKLAEYKSTNKALEDKATSLSVTVTQVTQDEIANLEKQLIAEQQKVSESRAEVSKVTAELERCKKHISALSTEFPEEMQVKIETLTKERAQLESKLREMSEDAEEREEHMKQTSERYSNRTLELQMKVEELSCAREKLEERLSCSKRQVSTHEAQLTVASSQHSGELSDLRSRLGIQLEEKARLQEEKDSLQRRLSQAVTEKANETNGTIQELTLKFENEAKEKRSLSLKIGDVEAELDRKEKQIKGIVDRYSKEVSDLEQRLDEQERANKRLQTEMGDLRNSELASRDTTDSFAVLKDRIGSLERSVGVEKALTNDAESARKRVEEKLTAAETAKLELERKFEKTNRERSEVINALEEVIGEVQNREGEIDKLAKVLRKREEELEHAKVIATKALASAQEIKLRFQERSSDRHTDLTLRITELNKMVDFVTEKNETLQKRTAQFERDLEEKEKECTRLKSLLTNGKSRSNDDALFPAFDSHHVKKSDDFPPMDHNFPDFGPTDTMSTVSADMIHGSDTWGNEFDATSSISSAFSANSSFADGTRTEPSERRKMERDALRKYVRKRYLKSKTSSGRSTHSG